MTTMTAKDKLRFTTTLLAYSAAVAAAMTSGCEQEPITCNTAHGSFAVKFTLMQGMGECAMLTSGIVGVQPYVRSGPNIQPRYDNVPVALKTEEMGALVAEYGQTVDPNKVFSLGAFQATNPGPDGFCPVVNLTPAEVNLTAVPARPDPEDPTMMLPALPAVTLKNEWSDVRFYVDPAFPGTQFAGDVHLHQERLHGDLPGAGSVPGSNLRQGQPGRRRPEDDPRSRGVLALRRPQQGPPLRLGHQPGRRGGLRRGLADLPAGQGTAVAPGDVHRLPDRRRGPTPSRRMT